MKKKTKISRNLSLNWKPCFQISRNLSLNCTMVLVHHEDAPSILSNYLWISNWEMGGLAGEAITLHHVAKCTPGREKVTLELQQELELFCFHLLTQAHQVSQQMSTCMICHNNSLTSKFLSTRRSSELVHWDDPEGCDGEGDGSGVQDGEHMYTHGWFMSMYGKNHYNTVK